MTNKKDLLLELLSQLKWSWEFSEILIDEIEKWNVLDTEIEDLINLLLDSAKKAEIESRIIKITLSSEINKALKEQESSEGTETELDYWSLLTYM